MDYVLQEIDYKKIFYYFEQISNVPRGSKNNKAISDYLVNFAKEHQLAYIQDELLNVIIIKEATKGYENADSVILQGHMDMVCEKDLDSQHDFLKEGLDLRIKEDYIYAAGTTLGADNGVALAYALAILDGEEYHHPKLEVIFTTDEEIGMEGATGLDTSMLTATSMLNIDSDEEDILIVGCAGGMRSTIELPLEYEKKSGVPVTIYVVGLFGGHSGTDIHKNRTNATLLLARLLFELNQKAEFCLIEMNGGTKDNVIPREAFAKVVVEASKVEYIITQLQCFNDIYQKELGGSEPNLNIKAEAEASGDYSVLTANSFDRVVKILLYMPNGIQSMSAKIENLVESSLNLGVFMTNKNLAHFSYSVRSSVKSYKDFLNKKLELFATSMGASYSTHGDYPAWEYKEQSRLREVMSELYLKEFGRKAQIKAIHAGLECGIIAAKMPGIDIVSLGPDNHDIHSPAERLNITSAKKVFDYVLKVLEHLYEKQEG